MGRRPAHGRLFALVPLLGLVVGGCGDLPPVPSPSVVLVPEGIGVVVAWDWIDCMPGRYTLDTGEVVTLVAGHGACGDVEHTPTPTLEHVAVSLPGEPGPFVAGPLVLYAGSGEAIDWYAMAGRPAIEDAECPFELPAAGYLVGDAVHLGSGLLLPLAEGFRVEPDWLEDPIEALSRGATLCLDATGTVVRARVQPTGY
jgi:hypothetical protein